VKRPIPSVTSFFNLGFVGFLSRKACVPLPTNLEKDFVFSEVCKSGVVEEGLSEA
jgi:hypothetical protein